jgi:hypothetical protein
MEHLKLFSTRLNIPRLIRVCQDHHHWKELVFLYVQYDEYDNAAVVMMQVWCSSQIGVPFMWSITAGRILYDLQEQSEPEEGLCFCC